MSYQTDINLQQLYFTPNKLIQSEKKIKKIITDLIQSRSEYYIYPYSLEDYRLIVDYRNDNITYFSETNENMNPKDKHIQHLSKLDKSFKILIKN